MGVDQWMKAWGDEWQRANRAEADLAELREKLAAFRTEYLTTCREWHGMSEREAVESLADFESEWDDNDAK